MIKQHFTLFNIARVIAAVILLQTLRFKFLGLPESVELFTQLGMEPHGRIGVGVMELIAGLLLLFGKKYIWIGAVISIGLMAGAIYFHLTILGIDLLFWMAVITLIASFYVLWHEKKYIPFINSQK